MKNPILLSVSSAIAVALPTGLHGQEADEALVVTPEDPPFASSPDPYQGSAPSRNPTFLGATLVDDPAYNTLLVGSAGQQAAPAVGLVLFGTKDMPTQGQIREDLRVMAHLLRKKAVGGLHAKAVMQAMGIKIHGSSEKDRPEARYIEGMGVLFKIPVHFPVAPVGGGSTNTSVQKVTAESDWDRAKRETLGAPYVLAGARANSGQFHSAVAGLAAVKSPRMYDKGFVASVEQALVAALKEAKNIRHLDAGDSIVVRILEVTEAGWARPPAVSPNRTVVNLRVKMEDILAAAEGNLDDEGFRKKVEIHRYVEY